MQEMSLQSSKSSTHAERVVFFNTAYVFPVFSDCVSFKSLRNEHLVKHQRFVVQEHIDCIYMTKANNKTTQIKSLVMILASMWSVWSFKT